MFILFFHLFRIKFEFITELINNKIGFQHYLYILQSAMFKNKEIYYAKINHCIIT